MAGEVDGILLMEFQQDPTQKNVRCDFPVEVGRKGVLVVVPEVVADNAVVVVVVVDPEVVAKNPVENSNSDNLKRTIENQDA